MTQIASRPPQYKKRGRFSGQVRNINNGLTVVTAADLPKLVDGWLLDADYRRLTPATIGNRRNATDKLRWWIEAHGVERIDTDAMRRFFAYVGSAKGSRWGREDYGRVKPISAGTVDTYYVYLQSFFSWAVGEHLIAVSPLERVPRPDMRSRSTVEPFSIAQLEALLEAAKYSQFAERDTALVMFLVDTGVRVSEACGAKIGDVDKTGKSLTVLGKGRKERLVRFGKETSMAIWRYLRCRHDGSEDSAPLFVAHAGNHSGSALTVDGMRTVIQRLGADAGIKGVRCSPHTFRHTFAIQFLRNGGNGFALQHLLGHASIKQTGEYVAIVQAHLSDQHVMASPMDNLRRRK